MHAQGYVSNLRDYEHLVHEMPLEVIEDIRMLRLAELHYDEERRANA